MQELISKNILLGITGGIAAYKCADLVRRLKAHGADVRVVMTPAAQEFIAPLTLQAVSGNPVHDDLLDRDAELAMGHIELARWADVVIVAPATANFMATLVHGEAHDLLSTVCLATSAPLAIAPAMNQQMWLNEATQANVKTLQQRQVKLFGPADGEQACGEVGPGRMLEPEQIVGEVIALFQHETLLGKRVLITAGPTREAIDPIRYLSNRSSGKMGFALARACIEAGAAVTLIAGPVSLTTPNKVKRIDVESAQQMLDAVMAEVNDTELFISVAAVADYRLETVAEQKIKKSADTLTLNLIRNPDILATVAKQTNKPFCVGFCMETENMLANAKTKLQTKNLDMIIANEVGEGKGFNSDDNAVTIIWQNGEKQLPLMPKEQLAREIVGLLDRR